MKEKIIPMLALSALCVNSSYAASKSKRSKQQESPNVILIYGDDMGKGMMSIYGQRIIETPNMDRLIGNGVQFPRSYGSHYSAPARSSLLTGYSDLHEGHWRIEKGGQMIVPDTTEIAAIEAQLDSRDVRLEEGDEYLAEVFKKAGYYTGQIGKLEYGFSSSRKQVKSHGWDYFYGFLDHERCHGFFPPYLYENEKIVMIDGNTRMRCGDPGYGLTSQEQYDFRRDRTGLEQYSQFLFDDKIAEFLTQHKDEPFFLYHPTQLPHGIVEVPYIHEKVKDLVNLTPVEKEYATMVLLFDESIGKILDKLDELGIADNTMIIFSVDNGHEIYYEADYRTTSSTHVTTGRPIDGYTVRFTSENVGDIFNGNMGMTGKKRSSFNGGINVPLSYYFPSKLKPRVCNELVAHYDLLSTMAEMVGVDVNPNKQGISYYKSLSDPYYSLGDDRVVVCDSYEGPALMTNDGWKVRYCNVQKRHELFDTKHDYREEVDLSSKYPEKYKELVDLLISNVEVSVTRGGYKPMK